MTAKPTDVPTGSARSIPITLPRQAPSPWAQARDNEFAVHVLLNGSHLPAPTMVARADAVYVTVADIDDLAVWLAQRGGEIHVGPAFEGLQTWTLHTATEPRRDGSSVQIRVSAAVVVDEPVLPLVRQAVVLAQVEAEYRARIADLEARVADAEAHANWAQKRLYEALMDREALKAVRRA